MKGTIIFADTFKTSENEIQSCPHIVMISPHEWNPHNVKFHSQARQFEDEMTSRYQISATQRAEFDDIASNDDLILILVNLMTE